MKLPLSSDEEGKRKYTWSRFLFGVRGLRPALPKRLTGVGSPIFPHHLMTETNTAALVLLVYWPEAMDSVQNFGHEYIHFTFFP